MKKVFLIVEFADEKGEIVYAVQYTGVMTRRNVYGELTSYASNSMAKYVKVSKSDTTDDTKNWLSVFSGRRYLSITVPDNIGMDDSRIHKNQPELFPEGVLQAVLNHVQECAI